MTAMLCAATCGLLALPCLAISILQFCEKGFLFNNASIWASKQERKTMNKTPHYRQSGIALALCAAVFAVMALEVLLQTGWLWLIVSVCAIALLIYVIVSSAREQTA